MEEEVSVSTYANRDDPLPIIRTGATAGSSVAAEDSTPLELSSDDDDEPSNRDSDHMPESSGTGKASDFKRGLRGAMHKRTQSLQDKLMEKKWFAKRRKHRLLKQIIPPDELDGAFSVSSSKFERSAYRKPAFSLPVMANNFRSFNARIGVVFVFQAQMIRLFTWEKPTHTLSFLATYSFLCLHPHLLIILPLALLLFFVFIPAYLARHPPPPSPSLHSPRHVLSGPPIAPPRVIKPATEMSQDFFRNMRDLQNTMGDFSKAHDAVLEKLTPWTNFSNEPLSSALFIILSFVLCGLYLIAPFLPLRHIFLFGGWIMITLCHPSIQLRAEKTYNKHVRPASLRALQILETWIFQDIVLDSTPEKVEVEIFELQRRRGGRVQVIVDSSSPTESTWDFDTGTPAEWEPWLFSPTPWEPMAPSRIAGERPKGTRFFEDVKPPSSWEWAGKKWILDLESADWVQGRMVSGCEVEIDGERWVYDVHTRKEGDKEVSKRGEWRRRRWIRTVQREKLGGDAIVRARLQSKNNRKNSGQDASSSKTKGKG